MKREALIRELRQSAKDLGVTFAVIKNEGKGSHYKIVLGDRATIIKSGELSNLYVRAIKKQLGV
ncbi:hypothetical protein [Jiella avicenniae]|uniref:Uncharacterized protein n=1 Tax=Jiella avicenniae TaxID=2907202 RepID=A0A9X1P5B8_9HYPH|nr:hypothetical protein [Jiella avicenniae]MCE7029526.1 hypothetical protein [Jiella avicenniae]